MRMLRNFRGMSQKELGIAIGLPEKGADNRITQYENGYRVPKSELLGEIAHVLRVNPNNFRVKNTARCKTSCTNCCGWTRNTPISFICLR